MSFIQSLGPIQYPLWIVAFLMLVQIVRGFAHTVGTERRHSPLRTHSILVLGTLGACVGVLGSLIGIRVVANVMEQAGELAAPAAIGQGGEFTAPVAWSGVGVALGPSVVGFFLLGVASVVWLVLQYAAGRRVAREQVQAEV